MIAAPIRLEPAFDDRDAVRALFYQCAYFQAAAAYLPDGSEDTGEPKAMDAVLPWFRGTWALGGKPLIPGAESILHNSRFLAAARRLFPGATITPKTVVVNVNAPMPSGVPHVDVPSFHGATRETIALKLLIAMGASGLFEPWRIVEAGAIAWFYDGVGGGFDYWPQGPRGAMHSEHSPFGNVAIIADNDRMFHRIGRVGEAGAPLPRMSAAAQIRPARDGGWSIFEQNELRASYPRGAVRLSVLWKAEAENEPAEPRHAGPLSGTRILDIFERDLKDRGLRQDTPGALDRSEWIEHVYRLYTRDAKQAAPRELAH